MTYSNNNNKVSNFSGRKKSLRLIEMMEAAETNELAPTIKGVDKETVHRICSGQVMLI